MKYYTYRAFSLITALLVLVSFASTSNAATTVTQDGYNLYVVGDDTDDSVYIYQVYYYSYYWVWVEDRQTEVGNWYYVSNVFVDTGDGDDSVEVYDYYGGYYGGGTDVFVETGNGDDSVSIFAGGSANLIDVSTGNGKDYVDSYSYYTAYYGGEIAIDTGNGKDEVDLRGYEDYLNVALGNGDDLIYGSDERSAGTIDGGKGKVTSSDLITVGNSLEVINFGK